MKTDVGTVLACDNRAITVTLHPRGECASCVLGRICAVNRNPDTAIVVSTDLEVAPGDRVEVMIDDALFLKVSVIMYGVPLAAFLAGVFAAYAVSLLLRFSAALGTVVAVVGGFAALAAGIAISLHMARQLRVTGRITRIFTEEVAQRL